MSADNVLKANIEEAAGVLRERLGNRKPAVGIVLGISLVSNMACGVEGASPSDVEVFEVAKEAEPKFCRLIEGIVEEAVL